MQRRIVKKRSDFPVFSLFLSERKSRVTPCFLLPVPFSELLSVASGSQFQHLTVFSLPYNVQTSPEDPSFSGSNLLWPGTAGVPFPPVSDDRQFLKLLLNNHCFEKVYAVPPRLIRVFWFRSTRISRKKVLSLMDSPRIMGLVISIEVISDGNRWSREAMRPVSTLLFYCRRARNR